MKKWGNLAMVNSHKDTKRLYRSRQDKIIGGVCGGIANYFNVDPILIRLFFILMFFAEGAGLLAYIIAWIIIPMEPSFIGNDDREKEETFSHQDNEKHTEQGHSSYSEQKNSNTKSRYLGLFFVVLGSLFLVDLWLPALYLRPFWPVIFIILGVVLLVRGVDF